MMMTTTTSIHQRILRSPITLFLAGALPIGIITGAGFMTENGPSVIRGLVCGVLFGSIMFVFVRRFIDPRNNTAPFTTTSALYTGAIPTNLSRRNALLKAAKKQISFYRSLRIVGSALAGVLLVFAMTLFLYSGTPPSVSSILVVGAVITLQVAFPTYLIRRLRILQARLEEYSAAAVSGTAKK